MAQADRASAPALVAHRFRLDRMLGRGGSGEVHAAFDVLEAKPVALKLLRADRVDQDDEALRAEFRILRGLVHPGIVRVFDFGRAEGVPFYTMELLAAHDLAHDLASTDPHAFIEQTAAALDYLHCNGLVHSDLKPSNVFRDGERFVVTDFGLVQRAGEQKRNGAYGTVAYLPPERLRGVAPDPRQDLYSLGAILFEILTGRPPYVRDDPDAMLEAIATADLEPELAQVAEEWRRLLRRLLAEDPTARFENAWALLQAWSATFDRPATTDIAWTPSFIGRRRELQQTRNALADLSRGRGAFHAVFGHPGAGKTAFAEAAAAQASALGVACVRIEVPSEQRPWALVDMLGGIYARWAEALPAAARQAATRLAEWPRAVAAATGEEGVLNANAVALADWSEVADAVPHVVLVDDAHRLDHASRSLLRFVAANARDLGVLFVVASRSESDDDGFAAAIARLRQSGSNVQVLSLRDLDADEVASVVQRRFGMQDDLSPLCDRILQRTRGHPFFVQQALRSLLESGQVRRQPAGWEVLLQAEDARLPRMADAILAEHVDGALAAHRAMFEALALFPSGATAEILAASLATDVGAVRAALAAGVRRGLLLNREGAFQFEHELIREACAARCPEATAQALHRAIAGVVAGTPAEAYHRLAGDDRSPVARACYMRQARDFESSRADWEALRLYEAAFAIEGGSDETLVLRIAALRTAVGRADDATALLAAQLEHTPTRLAPLARARYLHQMGEARRTQGRNADACTQFVEALDLLQSHGDAAERRRCATDLARARLAKGDLADAIATCTATLETAPAEAPAERAALLLLQAQAERQNGDHAVAEATCRRALELLKPLGRSRELAQAYTQIGTCHFYRHDYDEAERFYRTAVRVHSELGNLYGLSAALNNLAMTLVRDGREEEAIGVHEKGLELKRRLGDRPGQANSLNNLGNLWERRSDYRRALRCYRRGIGIYRHLAHPRELATLYSNMTELCVCLGRFHSAARLVARAREQAATLPGSYIAHMVAYNAAEVHLHLFEPHVAVELLRPAVDGAARSALLDVQARLHARLAHAYAVLGDADAARIWESAATSSLAGATESEARLDSLLDLGQVALVAGDPARALTLFDEASALAEMSEQSWEQARAFRLRAECDRRTGNWDRALARLAEASAICRTKGFRSELAKCYILSGSILWEIGLRGQAETHFGQGIQLLEALNLRTELGLTYLDRARASAPGRL